MKYNPSLTAAIAAAVLSSGMLEMMTIRPPPEPERKPEQDPADADEQLSRAERRRRARALRKVR